MNIRTARLCKGFAGKLAGGRPNQASLPSWAGIQSDLP